jgi:hypothetical protein
LEPGDFGFVTQGFGRFWEGATRITRSLGLRLQNWGIWVL